MTPQAASAQPTKILFAPKQDPGVTEIAKSLTPPGFELIMADFGTPEFINAAAEAEYFLGLARNMGGEFFRTAPKLKLVQLLSAGYDRVDVEAARKAKVPVANNGGANAIAVSEHTILLMLAVLKQLVRFHQDVVAGKWRPDRRRRARRAGRGAAEEGPPDLHPVQRHAHAALGGTDVGELDRALPQRLRQHRARGRRSQAAVGDSGARMITKFATVYAGHVDLPDMGQNATPANERRYGNEHLVSVFEKTDAVARS